MAVFTVLSKREISEIVADYGLPKAISVRKVREKSVNTHFLVDTVKGKFVVKIDEIKSEIEVKREQDLLTFLRKHGFPCPVPLTDRNNRHYRDWGGKALSVYRHIDGRVIDPEFVTASQLENLGRVLADLHLIGNRLSRQGKGLLPALLQHGEPGIGGEQAVRP